jgi:hypothetical protein
VIEIDRADNGWVVRIFGKVHEEGVLVFAELPALMEFLGKELIKRPDPKRKEEKT